MFLYIKRELSLLVVVVVVLLFQLLGVSWAIFRAAFFTNLNEK